MVRELLMGSRHFNDLRRGVPRMSPPCWPSGCARSSRPGSWSVATATGASPTCSPIPAPSCSRWSRRWAAGASGGYPSSATRISTRSCCCGTSTQPGPRRHARRAHPSIGFHFTDLPARAAGWWLVIDNEGVDVCDQDPGHPITVAVAFPLRLLVRVWRGDIGWSAATESGLHLDGRSWAWRALPRWLRLSAFAGTPRPGVPSAAAGR